MNVYIELGNHVKIFSPMKKGNIEYEDKVKIGNRAHDMERKATM